MNAKPFFSKRLALVSGCLNMGGSTTFLLNLAGQLIEQNIACEVFSLEHRHPLQNDFMAQKIPVLRCDETKEIYEDRLARIWHGLRQFNPSTVVAALAPLSFESLKYLPADVQRLGMIQSDDPGVYQLLEFYRDRLDGIVGVSQHICDTVTRNQSFNGIPVYYIPYGVPMPQHQRPAYAGPLRILYLGRLEQEQKRVRLFPQIFRDLCNANVPFVWTIAGSGPERAWLEQQMSSSAEHQRVVFAGEIAYSQVPKLLNNQDVFLLASDYEGLPLSLLEAMGHGLVPVVSNIPSGIPEVVNADNGFLINSSQTADYATALIELAKHPVLLKNKSVAARLTVSGKFSTAAMAERWLKILATPRATVWPEIVRIKPLDCHHQQLYYFPLLRPVRRLGKHLRHIFRAFQFEML